MRSARLLALVRCPECGGPLSGAGSLLTCAACGATFSASADYLDLRPKQTFAETTKYVDEALHTDARHETVSPPLLSARIRNDMLRAFLKPGPDDRIIDLGCGSGRTLIWNSGTGSYGVGIDAGPFFAAEARASTDLIVGDLRRLPFPEKSFTKAYALDVFEHLSRDTLQEVLRETFRVLEPGGSLFVYTHVRKNSKLAVGLRLINRLAEALHRVGLVDLAREHLRKSDHLNPLADLPDLQRVVGAAGFRIERIRYYTPIVGGFIENVLMRLAERMMTQSKARVSGHASDAAREARLAAKARIARRGPTYLALRALTAVMKLDVLLFGRVESGPFFALLVKPR